MWYKAFHCNNDQHNGQKVPKFVWIDAQWTERPQISNNLKFASPFVLKNHSNTSAETRVARGREYFYSVIFEISDKQMQFAELKNPPKQKKNDTLINQSQEIRPQGLDLGRSTSIRGCNQDPEAIFLDF